MLENSKENKQTKTVLARFGEVGYVDNVWCFNQHILRLGSIIYRLRAMGYDIKIDMHLKTDHNSHYYMISAPGKLSTYEVLHSVNLSDTLKK